MTVYDILDTVPYDSGVYLVNITGEELMDYIGKTLAEDWMVIKMLEFSDNVRVYLNEQGTAVTSITVDGKELEPTKMYTALSSSFVVNRMMNLPDERILDDMGILRILLWHVYEHYDPLTEDLLGEDRYVKS
ncbi:MAG: 5'-nucleotidase C-terminal domain-containing protein [Candidatus Methanomethylophilaceae archaeon]|nr:5'-nucleotidase C-terminal domain-containing protein [Candidatus Methanomethylophilaceae archaeon]